MKGQKEGKCNMTVVQFGECVCYKQLKDKEGRSGHKMESVWNEGVWLGHALSTFETIIGTDIGVVTAWAVKRRLEGERWRKEAVMGMIGTPSQPDPSKPGATIPIRITVPTCEDVLLGEVAPRRSRKPQEECT